MNEYRVQLDTYNGPLDLLLFLIRREEVDLYDIPIAKITAQYVEYVQVLKEIDPEAVGEFLVLAATLMEIKSRMLLPTPPPEEDDGDLGDPRLELVHQLLQYKKYKGAAGELEAAAKLRSLQHSRHPAELPVDPEGVELENLEIWDLYDAFNRLIEQTGRRDAVLQVSVDDTPVALHADDIVDALQQTGGSIAFSEVFAGRTRAEMIGLFLALLELLRRQRIRASQDDPNGPILIYLLEVEPESDMDDQDADEDESSPLAVVAFARRSAAEVLALPDSPATLAENPEEYADESSDEDTDENSEHPENSQHPENSEDPENSDEFAADPVAVDDRTATGDLAAIGDRVATGERLTPRPTPVGPAENREHIDETQ